MRIDDAVGIAVRGYRSRPSGVLPYYLLGTSTAAVTQTIWLIGVTATYFTLSAQGTLAPILTELRALGPLQIDDPTTFPDSTDALVTAFEAAVTPTLIAVVGATVVLSVVVTLAVTATAAAGQVHAVHAVLDGREPIRAGVDGILRDAVSFVALLVLQAIAMLAVVGLLLAGIVAAAATGPAGTLLAIVLVPAVPLAVLTVRLAFLFARQAVVVDGVGALAGVRHSLGYLRTNPVDAIIFLILSVVTLIALGVVTTMLSAVGMSAVGSLVGLAVAFPLLTFVKTALYVGHADGELPAPPAAAGTAASRLDAELRAGAAALGRFVSSRPLLQAASGAVFALGGALGWRAAAGVDGVLEASIAARLAGWFPPTAMANLAANNWQVGVAQAYGGFLGGIPTLASLLFNGISLGAIARIEVDPIALLTFVAPHGVVEIPGLIVAGALGLHLGGVGVRAATGGADRADLAAAVGRAYRILIGLALVFLVAAAIEAFVSPYYADLLGL
ncbi:Stage II sporulation protein M [Natronoarchaeum philippinense]|uniref:Stage II sporulation protein M n=1 Tax=Natronoarchaeum philippinense TaxID=558529 RepID=A0A285P7W8_NATPI|nr:stage II sporulation protein M [Natronoarchaeum philippinense]SNZ17814.1 Stage II sporulation protein M [Natronoarchaeum philippinense]